MCCISYDKEIDVEVWLLVWFTEYIRSLVIVAMYRYKWNFYDTDVFLETLTSGSRTLNTNNNNKNNNTIQIY